MPKSIAPLTSGIGTESAVPLSVTTGAAVSPGAAWQAPAGARAGLFARVPGRWRNGEEQRTLPALSLLWFDAPPPGDWRFEPDPTSLIELNPPAPAGWWLHHIPEGVTP